MGLFIKFADERKPFIHAEINGTVNEQAEELAQILIHTAYLHHKQEGKELQPVGTTESDQEKRDFALELPAAG